MNKNAESSLMEQKMQFLSNQIDRLMQSEDEIRSLRHDMNGHLSTLSALLQDGKTEEVSDYLAELTELHSAARNERLSDDPYINAVLNEYKAKCEKNNISFVCRIGVSEHPLPKAELCLILNNALENAVEASMKLPEKDRYIKVQAAVKQNRFLLRISNRFEGTLDFSEGLPATEKEGNEHGYGLSNIQRTAQKRGGTMDCRAENGFFVLDVQFPV